MAMISGGVEILSVPWQFETEHNPGFIDVFRISSDELIPVKLKLSLRAANLLMEEYPLATKALIKLSDTSWLFETTVCSLEGVGRFVMGLLDEVEVVDSPALKGYIGALLERH